MFCSNCGAENPNDAQYCKNCGKALNINRTSALNTSKYKDQLSGVVGRLKKMPKQYKIGSLMLVILIIIGMTVYTNISKTINLNDYLSFEATGHQGYGEVEAVIDWDSIEEKYGDKMNTSNELGDNINDLISLFGENLLSTGVDITLDNDEDLSNGDLVHYTWDIDEDITEGLGIKLKYTDGDYTVSGLEALGTFDAFEGLSVNYLGTAPDGYIELDTDGDSILYTYDYSVDKETNLSNGDIITVSADESIIDEFARDYGVVPETLHKTYTVSGLDEYVNSYADVDDDFLKRADDEVKNQIISQMKSYMYKSYNLDNITYAGYLFGKVNDESKGDVSYNDLLMVYSGEISSPNDEFETQKVYFPVSCINLIRVEKGIKCELQQGIIGKSSIGYFISTKGFLSPLVCFDALTQSYGQYYDLECGGQFESYQGYEAMTSESQLSDAFKEQLNEDAQDIVKAYIATDYDSRNTASDISIAGSYFLSLKDQSGYLEDKNHYIVVCQATISNNNGAFEPITVYYPVEYNGLVKLTNDQYNYSSVEGILGTSSIPKSMYWTSGYVDGKDMNQNIIEENKQDYKYEISESLKSFAE